MEERQARAREIAATPDPMQAIRDLVETGATIYKGATYRLSPRPVGYHVEAGPPEYASYDTPVFLDGLRWLSKRIDSSLHVTTEPVETVSDKLQTFKCPFDSEQCSIEQKTTTTYTTTDHVVRPYRHVTLCTS